MHPITQKPHVSFTYSPITPTTQETVQFNDTSNDIDGDISSWLWDFGDENISYLQNPNHRYIDNGYYTVTLNIIDNLGVSNYTKQLITVLNIKPTANFYYIPDTPNDLQNISFNDTSNDIDGYIISWLWDFGDNNTSDSQYTKHKYKDNGTYTVTLIVTDDDLTKTSLSKNIDVLNVKPTANIIFIPNKPTINDTITFIDSSVDYDGTIISWNWDLGDGTTSNKSYPTHKYNEGRTYKITLTVIDNDGDSDTKTMNIAVSDLSIKTQDYRGFIIVFIVFIVLFSIMIFFVLWIRKKEK
jgi:PKD repeat protein